MTRNLIDPTTIPLESELPRRKPEWLKVRLPGGSDYTRVKTLMRTHGLHTVCEEAMCPNIGECWGKGTATFLLMGDTCTRSCGFCHIKTGRPARLDEDEPRRVAESVRARVSYGSCAPLASMRRRRCSGLIERYVVIRNSRRSFRRSGDQRMRSSRDRGCWLGPAGHAR